MISKVKSWYNLRNEIEVSFKPFGYDNTFVIAVILKVSLFQNVPLVLLFGPKYQQIVSKISALELKSGQIIRWRYSIMSLIHWITHLIVSELLYYKKVPLFCCFDHFSNSFVGILVQTMKPKEHFEINWPSVIH